MQNKSTGDSALVIWDQLRFDISVYNQVSTAEAYRDAELFDRYFEHGFTAKMTDDWTLDATSPRLANFVARSLHFSPDIEVSTASELLYQKGVLASAIHLEKCSNLSTDTPLFSCKHLTRSRRLGQIRHTRSAIMCIQFLLSYGCLNFHLHGSIVIFDITEVHQMWWHFAAFYGN